MSKKDDEKLTINPWRVIKIFLIGFLIFEAIFYLSFQGAHSTFWPLDNSFYYYTPILFLAGGFFCYLSISQSYYVIDGAKFYHSKMGKVVEYNFSSIIYIDEEFSISKKMMRFFTKDGREHLLIFDRQAVLYHTALDKCSLISKEEFERRFPNIKM